MITMLLSFGSLLLLVLVLVAVCAPPVFASAHASASSSSANAAAATTNNNGASPRIECTDHLHRCYSYNLLSSDGRVLLRSADVPLAVCSNGQWRTESNGGLVRLSSSSASYVNSTARHGGDGSRSGGDRLLYSMTYNVTSTSQKIILTAQSSPRQFPSSVIFTTSFPDGLTNTSGCSNPITDEDGEGSTVISGWPTFRYPDTTYSNEYVSSSLSWSGSFMRPVYGTPSTGRRGGPTVFFGKTDAVVASPLDNYGAWSAGPGSSHDGSVTEVWAPGIPVSVEDVPAGFSSSTIVYVSSVLVGSRRKRTSITGAMHEWGSMLRKYHNSTPADRMSDVTLTKIGYQTDNGAYYCFCRGNCSATLLSKVQELKDMGVPMGYLSFQGAGASIGHKGAPWCVERWSADGGLGPNYPLPLEEFQKALGLPLQLYAPYFCPINDYFNSTGSRNWNGVTSDPSVPGCNDYNFWDANSNNSKDFYDWFFAKGTAVGMVSFEPDFMNQNRNCVPDFRRSVDGAARWQRGMADAASDAGLTIQWCYSTPSDVLASLEMDAVTNLRASGDFCYGNSWQIGVSSLLLSALGKAPSKDTLWTSPNNRTEIPGCSWTPDHEQPGAELHVTLALFSTGPVGISDGIGYTNASLVESAIAADGTLLKPSRPATLIDSLVQRRCSVTPASDGAREGGPLAEVLVTHSSDSESENGESSVRAWYLISFMLSDDMIICTDDLYPYVGGTERDDLAWRRFDRGISCQDGAYAVFSGCISADGDDIFLPAGDFSDTEKGSNYKHAVTSVYRKCSSGWRLLGELSKLVSLSAARFPRIRCNGSGVALTVVGSPGEEIEVTAIDPRGFVRVKTIALERSEEYSLEFQTDSDTTSLFFPRWNFH
mmetsp:Transcript_37414/g.82037  ORF Transcript_37414/g.82037 Transcript_37414/m.82037 type:complete len:879 (-) Transcript_37414:48-2684(-)